MCLESLAGNLPDADIEAVQKAFKREVLKRASEKTIEEATAYLPTWAALDGFRVSTHAISGNLNSVVIGAPEGVGYASFSIKSRTVKFNAEARKIVKRLKPPRVYRSYNFNEYNVESPAFPSALNSVLAELVPPGTNTLAMVEEIRTLVRKK